MLARFAKGQRQQHHRRWGPLALCGGAAVLDIDDPAALLLPSCHYDNHDNRNARTDGCCNDRGGAAAYRHHHCNNPFQEEKDQLQECHGQYDETHR